MLFFFLLNLKKGVRGQKANPGRTSNGADYVNTAVAVSAESAGLRQADCECVLTPPGIGRGAEVGGAGVGVGVKTSEIWSQDYEW